MEYRIRKGETLNETLRRFEQLERDMVRDRYNILLEFFNKFLSKVGIEGIESLTEIKKVNIAWLCKDTDHLKILFIKYLTKFANVGLMENSEVDLKLEQKQVLTHINRMLKIVDFKLKQWSKGKNQYISIYKS